MTIGSCALGNRGKRGTGNGKRETGDRETGDRRDVSSFLTFPHVSTTAGGLRPLARRRDNSVFVFFRGGGHCGFCKRSGSLDRTFSNTPPLIPPNYPRRSMLLMTVQPPISTIPCAKWHKTSSPIPCYHSPCSPRQPPPRQDRSPAAPSVPFQSVSS